LFPKEGETLFIFETARISLFPVGKKGGPAVGKGGDVWKRKVYKAPELKGKVAF
jgi:hypothetical protein